MLSLSEHLISDAKALILKGPTTDPAEVQHRIKILANAVVAVAEALRDLDSKVRPANL